VVQLAAHVAVEQAPKWQHLNEAPDTHVVPHYDVRCNFRHSKIHFKFNNLSDVIQEIAQNRFEKREKVRAIHKKDRPNFLTAHLAGSHPLRRLKHRWPPSAAPLYEPRKYRDCRTGRTTSHAATAPQ
jgi:hypothetical protein